MRLIWILAFIFANFLSAQVIQNEANKQDAQNYQDIQIEEVGRLVHSADPMIVIVDARPPQEDDGRRIPSAKIIPYDASINNLTANLPDKQALIITYCENARCESSRLMAERLVRMGYQQVKRFAGGLEEWEAHGLRIERGKSGAEAASQFPKQA